MYIVYICNVFFLLRFAASDYGFVLIYNVYICQMCVIVCNHFLNPYECNLQIKLSYVCDILCLELKISEIVFQDVYFCPPIISIS